jgi:hypothetical protein
MSPAVNFGKAMMSVGDETFTIILFYAPVPSGFSCDLTQLLLVMFKIAIGGCVEIG